MVVLWIPLSLDIPIFDSPNDMGLVSSPELYFYFVPTLLRVLEEEVETPSVGLRPFLVAQNQIAQT
jgi:hypothetical protein